MTLATLETALIEYVADVLVNDCGRPVPDRILRYHGTLPHDCCTDNGFLVINWNELHASTNFPANAGGACPGIPVASLTVRYVVCWEIPKVSDAGVTIADAAWDAKAAMLADVADCVARSLTYLACDPDRDDPFMAAVLAASGPRGWLRFNDASPITPAGGCAGVAWRIQSGITSGPVAS